MIKISHEVPTSLLKTSREFNDYDYALVHLFESHPEYYSFYEESLKMGREVLLDNSIFELEEAFDADRFAYWVQKLKPTKYIIPDSLDNMPETVSNLRDWSKRYKHLPGKKIGVVQGKNYEDLVDCYREIDYLCDEIAISFNYEWYSHLNTGNNLSDWCFGRIRFIEMLESDGVLNRFKPHHLLGCSLPLEFSYLRNKEFIKSLDTSNPVVHGLLGIEYGPLGLTEKRGIKLHELIEQEVDTPTLDLIRTNVNKFKTIVNG